MSFSFTRDGAGADPSDGIDEKVGRVNSVRSAFGATTSFRAHSSHLSILGGNEGTMSVRAALGDPRPSLERMASTAPVSRSTNTTSQRNSGGIKAIHLDRVPRIYGTGACTRSRRGAGTTGRYTWAHFMGYRSVLRDSQTAGRRDASEEKKRILLSARAALSTVSTPLGPRHRKIESYSEYGHKGRSSGGHCANLTMAPLLPASTEAFEGETFCFSIGGV